MAHETEMYILFPEGLEDWGIAPAVIVKDLDMIKASLDELQKAISRTGFSFRVLKITEVESVYQITPDETDEEYNEEDLIEQISDFLRSREDSPFKMPEEK